MLGINYNNTWFDLYPKATISMEINNPVFDDSILTGNYSFPFKIPLTPRNRQLLNFPDDPGSVVNFNAGFIVDLYIEGLLLFPQGQLFIKTVAPTYAECYILIGISSFAQFANNTKIADIMDYIVQLSVDLSAPDDQQCGKVATASLTHTVDTLPYIFFPVENDTNYPPDKVDYDRGDYYEMGLGATFYNVPVHSDRIDADFVSVISTDQWDHFTPATMVPFFYVTYILRKIFANADVASNIFDNDAELKTLVLLNNFCLDNYIDEYTRSTYYKTNTGGRNMEAGNHVPDMLISNFLIALKNFFCLYLYKDPFSAEMYFDSMNTILATDDAVDWTSITYPSSTELSQDVDYGISFQPKSNGDLMNSNNPSTEKEIIAGANYSLLPTTGNLGDLWYLIDQATYYKWGGTQWNVWGHGYGDYYINPRKISVASEFTGAPNKDYNIKVYSNGYTFNLPSMSIAGSYYQVDDKTLIPKVVTNPNCVKLCFYRGQSPADSAYPYQYPLGSCSNYFHGHKIGNYSLAFLGDYGLFAVWWKKYLNFRAYTKVLKANVKLDLVTLLNLDLRKKYAINGQHYFIKKISLVLPLTKPAQVEFWLAGGMEDIVAVPKPKTIFG